MDVTPSLALALYAVLTMPTISESGMVVAVEVTVQAVSGCWQQGLMFGKIRGIGREVSIFNHFSRLYEYALRNVVKIIIKIKICQIGHANQSTHMRPDATRTPDNTDDGRFQISDSLSG